MHRRRMVMSMTSIVTLFLLLFFVQDGVPQDSFRPQQELESQRLVEFSFIDSDMTEVLQHVIQLTGWSVFYDPVQVTGKVTLLTPGQIPLEQAIRLLQGIVRSYGYTIHVLPPGSPQPVLLTSLVAEAYRPPARRDVIVWRNSDARGPRSRPYDCDTYTRSPLLPYGLDVIVDVIR